MSLFFYFSEWVKTDIEGALFIYERNAEPFHSIFINNRLNTNSLVEPITRFELQAQPPFLLYRNERSKIRGFWFYNVAECDRIGELVTRLVKHTTLNNKENNTSTTPMGRAIKIQQNVNAAPPANVNILSMLSKAQEDFNKVTTTTGLSGVAPNTNNSNRAMNNPSVMNFFGAIPTDPATLQRLKPAVGPPVHTVDEIEKKHRANTPQQNDHHPAIGRVSPDPVQELGTSPSLVTFFNSVNLAGSHHQVAANRKNFPMMNAKALSEIEQQQTATIRSPGLITGVPVTKDKHLLNSVNFNIGQKPALMPPTMFEATGVNNKFLNGDEQRQNAQPPPPPPIAPLTKDQMIVAMTYLMKTDANFVNKLHEAYLKSVAHQNMVTNSL